MFKLLARKLVLVLFSGLVFAQAPQVAVTTRAANGAPLTFAQGDNNFLGLQYGVNGSLQAFGYKQTASTGLVFGVYGGYYWTGSAFAFASDATVTLTASNTNYVQISNAGVVSTNTTGFSSLQLPLYKVTTGSSSVTGIVDARLAFAVPSGTTVTSFNTRTGAVVPTTGDYTVAQVTNSTNKTGDTFSGTMTFAAGTSSIAPWKLQAGALLTSPAAHSFEWDGSKAYFTDATPTRHTVAFLDSPAFTGTPTAPTATAGTNTTQIATTAFVTTALAGTSATHVQRQVFTSSGTFTPATGVNYVWVVAVGGGGGGGGGQASVSTAGGGGGGAGATVYKQVAVTPGVGITVTIGAAGTAGTTGNNGGTGGDTTFGALLTAKGGQGGFAGASGVGGNGGNSGGPDTTSGGGRLPIAATGDSVASTSSTPASTTNSNFYVLPNLLGSMESGGGGGKGGSTGTNISHQGGYCGTYIGGTNANGVDAVGDGGSGGSSAFGQGGSGGDKGSLSSPTSPTANTGAGGGGAWSNTNAAAGAAGQLIVFWVN